MLNPTKLLITEEHYDLLRFASNKRVFKTLSMTLNTDSQLIMFRESFVHENKCENVPIAQFL